VQDTPTVDALIDQAITAYDTLTEVGEAVDDEWTYIDDLSSSWRARLDEVGRARAGSAADPETGIAIERAIEEVGSIDDPHQAIDWLSTFPQVVLLALGEPA
jgi:hypothetical protein